MRKTAAATILAAAVAGVGFLYPANLPAQAAGGGAAVAAKPGDPQNQAQLPVKQVVLYSSGVGYFEHFGSVNGNGTTELRFKTAQINDILKSLVLQDMDKGKVGVITYPSQDPVAKTLRSFQIDITANPTLADLLNQLRGARVSVQAGAEKVSGTVLGVERKPRPVGEAAGAKVIDVAFLNLITEAGAIRSVSLEEVRGLEIADPRLREELTRALAALAAARDTDKKPVTISFQGQGERRLRVGYVVETPVWKTSYRLVVGADAGPAGADADAKPAAGAPVNPVGGAAGKPAAHKGALQGWAIVENQTDNDWADVQLSLVSGRPISFIQDLYQPLYVPRPVVQAELYASLRPQTYDAGMDMQKKAEGWAYKDRADKARADEAGEADARRLYAKRSAAAGVPAKPGAFGGGGGGGANGVALEGLDAAPIAAPMDVTSSVSSVASAAKLGELFQYTVGNVTLPRQTSAMIPVVTDPVEVEKVSIYNLAVLPKNPLLGARVKNTTGKHLLQGPVTVLDGGKYAGDARIDDVPPGQERLISYGVDQQVIVQAKNDLSTSTLRGGKIVNGVLHLTYKDVQAQTYTADNKGDADKTLVIEHARLGGEWKLVEPAKADETTDALYRFKGSVGAGKATKLTVKQELVRMEFFEVLPLDLGTAVVYSNAGELPKEVRDALAKAAQLKQAVVDTDRLVNDRQQKVSVISQEQNRIRENLKTVAQNSEYYGRLLKKLNDQETQIEGLQKEITDLQAQREKQQKALADYVSGLSVG
ncbi:MAG TPA: hypothetical protein VF796_25705 [Humisphaera sp.]